MSNPNRCMANLPSNPSMYWTFPSTQLGAASRFADFARAAGYRVRESRFRIGPRKANQFQYRVSVYWTRDQIEPDKAAFDTAARWY